MHSSLLQIAWAAKQLQELETDIETWIANKPYTLVTKPDREPLHYIVVADAEPIPYWPISLLISGVLHGFRSGLDHIAYALAARYTAPLTDDIIKNSQFPIFGDVLQHDGTVKPGRKAFRDARRYIKGVAPAAQAVIESLQPYHRGNAFKDDPLWRLNELSNIDKHRLLHPAAHTTGGTLVNVDDGRATLIFPPMFEVKTGFLEKDTVIVRYRLNSANAEMDVDFQPALDVAFPKGSTAEGEPVVAVLRSIHEHITTKVIPPLNGMF